MRPWNVNFFFVDIFMRISDRVHNVAKDLARAIRYPSVL